MTEYTVEAEFAVEEDWSGIEIIYQHAAEFPDHHSFREYVDEQWVPVTITEFLRRVEAVALGLIDMGIDKDDRVAVMANNSLDWCIIDFAIWAAGAVTVPIYESSSADQITWIMQDSGSKVLFIGNEGHQEKVNEAIAELDSVSRVLTIDGSEPAVPALTQAHAGKPTEILKQRRAATVADDLATIIYTSGTTGRPKGCMLPHRAFRAASQAGRQSVFGELLRPECSTLMFLPLAHVFARAVTMLAITARVTTGFTSDIDNLGDHFVKFKPNLILSVPRVFEKVYDSARTKARDSGGLKSSIFAKASDTAIAYSAAQAAGSVPLSLKAKHGLYDKLVYGKLRDALGGQCDWAISGGAPLGERLAHFYNGVGIPVYEGYGLTESTAAATVCQPGENWVIGSVGRAVAGLSVKLASDGELMLRGETLFTGYWNNEKATSETFDGDWFATGDLAKITDDGNVFITGRKKEIIVTAGGKNVAPAPLEDALRSDPLISQAVLVGDQEKFIGALVTLSEESLERWASEHDKPSHSVADLREDKDLLEHIQRSVNQANKSVSAAEAIKKFTVLPADFTEATGELTPSMKVKRAVVMKKYSAEVEALYGRA